MYSAYPQEEDALIKENGTFAYVNLISKKSNTTNTFYNPVKFVEKEKWLFINKSGESVEPYCY